MADEDEATAGLVGKNQEYPKTQAKPASTSEFEYTATFLHWPPVPSEDHLASALEQWQQAARDNGLVPAKTAEMATTGQDGRTYIKVVGRVKKASK